MSNTDSTIRSFIALELSDEAKREILRIENILRARTDGIKWSDPVSVHLTLKFLGDIEENAVPRIAERLDKIASGTFPFDFVLAGLGVFPDWRFPRVIWLGTGEGSDRISDIAGKVERTLAEEGFEREARSFRSHLTIGRVGRPKNRNELQKIAESITVTPVSSHIPGMVLFMSVLTSKGAIHTPLHNARFKG